MVLQWNDLNNQTSTSLAFLGAAENDLANGGVSHWFAQDLVFSNGLRNNAGTSALGFVFRGMEIMVLISSYHNSAEYNDM